MRRTVVWLGIWPVALFAALLVVGSVSASSLRVTAKDFNDFEWTEVYDGPVQAGTPGWSGRAGLQAVELRNRLFVMGGRTPDPDDLGGNPFRSTLWNDVWESRDLGASWTQLQAPPGGPRWSERAYFQAVTKGGAMFVLGGQNLISGFGVCLPGIFSCSDFYNDVWRSDDGTNWERLEGSGERWKERAGLSAIEFKGWIYVLGGSYGDDFAIGGGVNRELFNDVWRSRDGKKWERVTDHAPWLPRAGAAVVEKNGYIYLLGGENGFSCPPGGSCSYFNDVWRSRDGARWELVTEHADWSARPGHQCQVLSDSFVCFGGFGFPTNPYVAAHPVDVWVSRDGKDWEKLDKGPWKATESADVKYDFDSLVVRGGRGGLPPSIYTFGGDREASFLAASAALVDDEVWRFSPPRHGK